MKFLHNGLVLITMGLFPTANPAGTVHTQPLPTAEFLEFLSEWETDQGEWVGPALFEDDSFDQLFEEADGGEENDLREKDDVE